MPKGHDPTATTAYASNTRSFVAHAKARTSGWAPGIERLLQQGYQFLPTTYADGGVLFRGMSCGLRESMALGRFDLFEDPRPVCRLERQLGVIFVSNEPSDAISVARMWEPPGDNVIVVVRCAWFTEEWRARRAAVMGLAEPGMVFKYPLLSEALPFEAIAHLIVSGPIGTHMEGVPLPLRDRLIALGPETCGDRRACEHAVLAWMAAAGLCPARAIETEWWPRWMY